MLRGLMLTSPKPKKKGVSNKTRTAEIMQHFQGQPRAPNTSNSDSEENAPPVTEATTPIEHLKIDATPVGSMLDLESKADDLKKDAKVAIKKDKLPQPSPFINPPDENIQKALRMSLYIQLCEGITSTLRISDPQQRQKKFHNLVLFFNQLKVDSKKVGDQHLKMNGYLGIRGYQVTSAGVCGGMSIGIAEAFAAHESDILINRLLFFEQTLFEFAESKEFNDLFNKVNKLQQQLAIPNNTVLIKTELTKINALLHKEKRKLKDFLQKGQIKPQFDAYSTDINAYGDRIASFQVPGNYPEALQENLVLYNVQKIARTVQSLSLERKGIGEILQSGRISDIIGLAQSLLANSLSREGLTIEAVLRQGDEKIISKLIEPSALDDMTKAQIVTKLVELKSVVSKELDQVETNKFDVETGLIEEDRFFFDFTKTASNTKSIELTDMKDAKKGTLTAFLDVLDALADKFKVSDLIIRFTSLEHAIAVCRQTADPPRVLTTRWVFGDPSKLPLLRNPFQPQQITSETFTSFYANVKGLPDERCLIASFYTTPGQQQVVKALLKELQTTPEFNAARTVTPEKIFIRNDPDTNKLIEYSQAGMAGMALDLDMLEAIIDHHFQENDDALNKINTNIAAFITHAVTTSGSSFIATELTDPQSEFLIKYSGMIYYDSDSQFDLLQKTVINLSRITLSSIVIKPFELLVMDRATLLPAEDRVELLKTALGHLVAVTNFEPARLQIFSSLLTQGLPRFTQSQKREILEHAFFEAVRYKVEPTRDVMSICKMLIDSGLSQLTDEEDKKSVLKAAIERILSLESIPTQNQVVLEELISVSKTLLSNPDDRVDLVESAIQATLEHADGPECDVHHIFGIVFANGVELFTKVEDKKSVIMMALNQTIAIPTTPVKMKILDSLVSNGITYFSTNPELQKNILLEAVTKVLTYPFSEEIKSLLDAIIKGFEYIADTDRKTEFIMESIVKAGNQGLAFVSQVVDRGFTFISDQDQQKLILNQALMALNVSIPKVEPEIINYLNKKLSSYEHKQTYSVVQSEPSPSESKSKKNYAETAAVRPFFASSARQIATHNVDSKINKKTQNQPIKRNKRNAKKKRIRTDKGFHL